jgi:hypothetical protein
MPTSYEDTVLEDSPALFWRLDVDPPATDGQTVPDLSGNGLDGSLVVSGTDEAWGLTSPIETDGSSTEFWGYTASGGAPAPFETLGGVSRITRASDALLTVSGDFAIEEWLRPMDERPGAIDFAMAQKQGSGGTMLCGGANTRIGGFVFDWDGATATRWDVIDTSFRVIDHLGESFHVVVTRVGNTLALYINGSLRTTTIITSGLPTLFNSSPFVVQPSTGFYNNARHDEVAWYTHSLTGPRVRAHYDAARLVLPLRSRLTIRSTLTLDTTQEELVEFPFDHNFAQPFGDGMIPINEQLSYFTDVIPSRTDYEQRITLRAHGPSRTLQYQVTPSSPRAKAILNAQLFKPAQTYLIPISNDRTPLTADADTGDNTISLDTIGRDFEVGSRLRLGTWDDYETCVIDTVSETEIEIVGTLANDWPTGTSVRPVRKAKLIQNKIKSHAADRESDTLEFQILSGELSTNRAAEFTPTLTYRDEEIFNLERVRVDFLQEVSIQDFRRVNTLDNKTGALEQLSGDTGTARSIPVRLLYRDRAGMADFFGWLDTRLGQSTPLWVVSWENDLQAVSGGGSTLTIQSIGYTQRYNLHSARRDVCFILNDSTFTCLRVTGTVDNLDGTETLSFDGSVPTLADVNRISWLKYCRLQGDEIEIEWHRASSSGRTLLECSLSFRELLTSPD